MEKFFSKILHSGKSSNNGSQLTFELIRDKVQIPLELHILRRWSSYSSITPQSKAYEKRVGGAFVLSLPEIVVIDPGPDTLSNMFDHFGGLPEISTIIVTHYHTDHFQELGNLLDCFYEIDNCLKRKSEYFKSVKLFLPENNLLSTGTYYELECLKCQDRGDRNKRCENSRRCRYRNVCLTRYQYIKEVCAIRNGEKKGLLAKNKSPWVEFLFTDHRVDKFHEHSAALKITPAGYKHPLLGYSSDASGETDPERLADFLHSCRIVILNCGSITACDIFNGSAENKKGRFKNHLDIKGIEKIVLRMLEKERSPEVIILNEFFCAHMEKDYRLTVKEILCDRIQKQKSRAPKIIIGELGLRICLAGEKGKRLETYVHEGFPDDYMGYVLTREAEQSKKDYSISSLIETKSLEDAGRSGIFRC